MKAIKINKNDNVAVASEELKAGDLITVQEEKIRVQERIPMGNKIALVDIEKGRDILKYGYKIGYASEKILKGSLVHSHNLVTALNEDTLLSYKYKKYDNAEVEGEYTFKGYRRSDGRAGVRNEIFIIPTVGCVNTVCRVLEKRAKEDYKFDDITALTHQFGCSQLGSDHLNFQKMLAGLCKNPNAGGVLVVSLGCENNTLESFIKILGDYDSNRIKFLKCQESKDEIDDGLKILKELIDIVIEDTREDIPVSSLTVGLKCGGSDGLSGITSNPVIGAFSDILVSLGGSVILTEVPEMFGGEQNIAERCADEAVFNDFTSLIKEYKKFYTSYNLPIYENPSPGNKAGGITTLEEKSLGCVLKGGISDVMKITDYCGDGIVKGLNLTSSPGNDLIASTALAASGAQIILFSTGRGTPFSSVVPTIKISSNTPLFNKKNNWIDFNAGEMLEDGKSVSEYGKMLFDYLLGVACGEKVKSELYGFKEIAFFKTGVTL